MPTTPSPQYCGSELYVRTSLIDFRSLELSSPRPVVTHQGPKDKEKHAGIPRSLTDLIRDFFPKTLLATDTVFGLLHSTALMDRVAPNDAISPIPSHFTAIKYLQTFEKCINISHSVTLVYLCWGSISSIAFASFQISSVMLTYYG